MDLFGQIAEKIIKEQESIMGPIALEQAKKVSGLTVNWEKHEVSVAGNQKSVLEQLVIQYQHLFGQASVEVCKDAVKSIIGKLPADQVPALLH